MKWSWKLGRFAGIDTYVHASFLLLVAYSGWQAYKGFGTGLAVFMGVLFLLAVFGSVLLHEFGHALTARRYGIATRSIVLSPLGGIAQLEGMPSHPREELAVALAGPAVNFVLAGGLWLLSPVLGSIPLLGDLVTPLVYANLVLGLFNLIPAFPMDGGRALRALLASRIGDQSATEIAAKIGKTAALIMGTVGLFTNPFLVLVAGFVWFAANAEQKMSRFDHRLYPYGNTVVNRRRQGFWGDLFNPPRYGTRRRVWPWNSTADYDVYPQRTPRVWVEEPWSQVRPVRVVVMHDTHWPLR